MIRLLIKLPRHKQFNYTPIYYDEAKEDLMERVGKLEDGGSIQGTKIRRGSLKESWGRSNRVSKSNKESRRLLMMLIISFSFLAWYFFFS